MARQMMWRRTVSDAVSWRQDQANNATIYILREFGPTGFLLKEEGETKNFKVNCSQMFGSDDNYLFNEIHICHYRETR